MKTRPMLAFGGFRRGGSSVGFMILQHLLIESGLRCSDKVKELWDQGVRTSLIGNRQLLPEFRDNALVGCFRAAPNMTDKALAKVPLFLLVRDPRDCQTSWFHARHLHQQDAVPQVIVDKARLHEALIEDDSFDADVASLLDWCASSGGRIFRYEDLVLDPLAFILEFQEFSGLPLKRSAIDLALLKAAFFQAALDPADHNRSGVPFEALRTLALADLKRLNKRFAPLLDRLGYPLQPGGAASLDLSPLIQRDAMKRYVHGLADQNGLRIAQIRQLEQQVADLCEQVEQLRRAIPGG